MIQTIDLTGIEHQSSDPQLLRAYLQQLIHQPFLHFRFSYGDELSLHFGNPRSYASPRMKHLSKGSFIVAARASRWFLGVTDPPSTVIGTGTDDAAPMNGHHHVTARQLENSALVKPGVKIVTADPVLLNSVDGSRSGLGLSLLLSGGSTLFIEPNLSESIESDDPADWEVFTPHNRCLAAGPGANWAYADSAIEVNKTTV